MVAHKLASVTIYTTSFHVFDLLPNCIAPILINKTRWFCYCKKSVF